MLSSQAVGHFGIATVVWLNAALLAAAAFAALLVPQLLPTQDAARATAGVRGVGALLRLPLSTMTPATHPSYPAPVRAK